MSIYYMMKPWGKQKGYELDPVLNKNSWEAIQWAAQQGLAPSTWNVGDMKYVILNGVVGGKTFLNQIVFVYILGFNHNASVEGNNTIHFGCAMSGSKRIAFCDSSYGSNGSTAAFRMNTTNTNKNGWSGSYMRNTIIPAFINAMPSDLQSALKAVTKYTDNANATSHNTKSYVTATQDKAFLLAEWEIFGTRTYANQYEKNSQAQYDYYKNVATTSTSRRMYKDNATSTAAHWHGRSPYYANGTGFCRVYADGSTFNSEAHYSYGFAPAFVVG